MDCWRNSLAIALLLLSGSGWAGAQDGHGRDRSPRSFVANRFEESAPRIGEALPDLSLFDADGEPFLLSSLKGSHTVLVFGCLT